MWRTGTMLDLSKIGMFQTGDQTVLFYYLASLDQSETSMLDSAGFESHRPVTN
jgi:hypothetical protein